MPTSFSGPIRLKGSAEQVAGRKMYGGMDASTPNPDIYFVWDDFLGVALDSTNDWTVVKDTGATVALGADAQFGTCVITSAATTDDDGGSIQGNEVFAPTSGKDLWFETRVSLHDADDCDFMIGLTENFATNPEAMLAAANHIAFQIAEGDATFVCRTESGGTATTTTTSVDAADATWVKLGFKVTSTSKVEFYINGALVATHTTNIPTANMTIGAYTLSGSTTGTFASSIDYVLCAAQR